MRERIILALAFLLCGGLVTYASTTPPEIHVRDARAHIGHAVQADGFARDVEAWDGGGRFTLAADGHGLRVHTDEVLPEPGAYLRIEGRVSQYQGAIRLHAEHLALHALPDAVPVDLATIALAPTAWTDRTLLLRGTVDDGALHASSLQLELTPPPADGPHDLRGVLAYHAPCLCHRLEVHEATPWTS